MGRKNKTKARRRDIEAVCISLCADYKRRKLIVDKRLAEKRIVMEYAYINARIFDAACEIVGCVDAEKYIEEIGRGIGYAKSEIETLCERTYKINKGRMVANILKKIYYVDSYSDFDEFCERE